MPDSEFSPGHRFSRCQCLQENLPVTGEIVRMNEVGGFFPDHVTGIVTQPLSPVGRDVGEGPVRFQGKDDLACILHKGAELLLALLERTFNPGTLDLGAGFCCDDLYDLPDFR